jgi:LmeA-like phospholipid-binding
MTTTAGPPRRRTGRPLAVVVGVLAGLGLLLWGIDRVTRQAAESLLAEEVQQATGTVRPPAVEIGPGPVLLQALRGRYDQVEVTMPAVSNGPLTFDRVHAELSGVHLSLHALLVRDADAVVLERTRADALLRYDDLDRYLGFTGRQLTVTPAGEGEVRITGSGQVLDRRFEATATGTVQAEPGALVVRPIELVAGPDVDRAAELLLAERFRLRVPLDPLPFGREVRRVEVGEEGVTVRTSGAGVVVRG